MNRRQKNRANYDGRLDDADEAAAEDGFDEYTKNRAILAFAGMGALLGLLVGGTVLGFPIAISSTIIGGIGGGILGKYLKTDR